MANFEHSIDGDKLTITVDLSKNMGRSKSGKSILIASSTGNMGIGDGVVLGLNVYKPVGA